MLMDDRIRRVVLQITGDMSLTEDIDDAQASLLLDWGSSMATHLALTTVDLEDDQADTALEPHMTNLRRAMRRVNKLFVILDGATEDELVERLASIFEAVSALPGKAGTTPDLPSLAGEIVGQPPDVALSTILAYL